MRAYALMRQPEELEVVYAASPVYERARLEIGALRAALPAGFSPRFYRGIGRYPFSEYPERGPGWDGEDVESESHARTLMLNVLGPYDNVTPYPRAFLGKFEDAKSVYAALFAKQMYEIVELCTVPECPRNLLGFDTGYWGGGNYSVLCDAAIWPRWHPPVPAALSDLSIVLNELNQYGLFPTEHSARAYLDWYNRQSWAEKEPSDFNVIAVGAID